LPSEEGYARNFLGRQIQLHDQRPLYHCSYSRVTKEITPVKYFKTCVFEKTCATLPTRTASNVLMLLDLPASTLIDSLKDC